MRRTLGRGAAALLGATIILAGAGSGCSGRDVPLDAAPDEILAAAQRKLDGEDWYDAAELYEAFLRNHPGSAQAPLAKIRLGDARFGLEEYLVARTHYEDVVQDFPASAWVEEARWGIARCSYASIRSWDRDPTEAERALVLLEEFTADHPSSRFRPDADAAIADCRERLAHREFDAGEFYAKQRRPRSAKIQFQYVLDTFPETAWARKACLAIGEIYRLRGKDAEAERYLRRVVMDWPDTEESRQAAASLSTLGIARAEEEEAP